MTTDNTTAPSCVFNNLRYLGNNKKEVFCIKTCPNFYEIYNDRDKLNNCLVLHIHKDLSDTLDFVSVANKFIINDEGKGFFLVRIL